MTINIDHHKLVDFRPLSLFVMTYREVDYSDDAQYQRRRESGDHSHSDEDDYYGHSGHCNNRYWPDQAGLVVFILYVGTSTLYSSGPLY